MFRFAESTKAQVWQHTSVSTALGYREGRYKELAEHLAMLAQ